MLNVTRDDAPLAPTETSVSYSTSTQKATVTWVDNATDETDYEVWRKIDGGDWVGIAAGPASLAADTTSFTDPDTYTEGQTLEYRVRAGKNNVWSGYDIPPLFTVPPLAPSAATAAKNGLAIDVSWTDNSAVEGGFKIYRKKDTDPYIELDTNLANDTTYTDDTLLTVGSVYTYRITAILDDAESAHTESNSVTY